MRPRISLAEAVVRLTRETNAACAWAMFDCVVGSDLRPRARFFQAMLGCCRRCLPGKAPDVLRAAIAHRVPVGADDALFRAFLAACQVDAGALWRDALQLYVAYGPRSHQVVADVADLCRRAHHASAALPVVRDALLATTTNGATMTPALVATFAACCAEARCPDGADTADLIVGLLRAGRIPPALSAPTFANLLRALLAHDRLDAALLALNVMDGVGAGPAPDALALVLGGLSAGGRIVEAVDLFDTAVSRALPVARPDFIALLSACGRTGAAWAVRRLHDYVETQNPAYLDASVAVAFIAVYDRVGDVDGAERIFRAHSTALGAPDADVFAALLQALFANGMAARALRAFAWLLRSGLPVPGAIGAALLVRLADGGRPGDAFAVLLAMRQRHVGGVGTRLLRTLVGACARAPDALATLPHLEQYAVDARLLPGRRLAPAFVAAYGRCGDMDAAERVFRAAAAGDDADDDDARLLCAMIGACTRNGMTGRAGDLAERLAGSASALTPAAYACVVAACADADRVPAAMLAFQAMARRRMHVGASLLAALASACERCGDQRALQVLAGHAATTLPRSPPPNDPAVAQRR
ncbi:Pentacotripeptide-repeat region of PRORP domain-containing protein [Plasmodiophora brassicae]